MGGGVFQNLRDVGFGLSGEIQEMEKQDLLCKLAKYLTEFGRVLYNSLEEGSSHTIREGI